MVNNTKMTISPLIKYRSVCKTNPSNGKKYQVALVVRENGRFEVYADFILVNEYTNPKLQCVDIATDFNQFYLKFVKHADRVTANTKLTKLKFQIRQVMHIWRNRISISTTKVKKNIAKWDWVIHRRIAKYFRLYSQILNFSMYMLVSHRNMISIFDMTGTQAEGGHWVQTISFSQGAIRQMLIKKRSKLDRLELKSSKAVGLQ